MYNFKIKNIFLAPICRRHGLLIRVGFNLMIVYFYILRRLDIVFQYGYEPVLIHWILIVFEAILENNYLISNNSILTNTKYFNFVEITINNFIFY